MRTRQIAPVALVLLLTVAGFVGARRLGEHEARSDSQRRVEVAAAQIRGRVEQAASLTESLQQFMLGSSGTGVTGAQFATNALQWLTPAGFPAAAWVEPVPGSRRVAYERRTGQPIVTPDPRRLIEPRGSRSSYLPATLVSGFPPLDVSGVDLSGAPGMAAALARAAAGDGATASSLAQTTGTRGLFLVAPAPDLILGVLHSGYVAVFVSDTALRAATDMPTANIVALRTSTRAGAPPNTSSKTFTAAGQRFDVILPRESVQGAAAVLPWLVLAAGLVLAALAVALGINGARRARTQEELDRVFTLSSDLIAVADFHGFFTRVNPAAARILGYTEEELCARPYFDFVHPEDRDKTAAEAAALGQGRATLSFENRYLHKNGSVRVLEWKTTPIVEEGTMYGVARDVTDRRQTEAERERLADEQAALRRVATLVAQGVKPAKLFSAVSQEVARLFGTGLAAVGRFDPDGPAQVVVGLARPIQGVAIGSRYELTDSMTVAAVYRTGRSARLDRVDWSADSSPVGEIASRLGTVSAVSSPIVVGGRLWGAVSAVGTEPLPMETEERLEKFTALIATAIANAESGQALARLAEEQAALRRVATLVAEGASPTVVFDAVAAEMARLLGADHVVVYRYEPVADLTVLAYRGFGAQQVAPGTRLNHEGDSVEAVVRRTNQSARMESDEGARLVIAEQARAAGVRVAVGAPIVVDGRLWGVVSAGWHSGDPPPADTEQRMAHFAELLDTAIANADSRDQLAASRERLVTAADEARRRVVRDLHDGAQQRLVHTIVTLKLAQRELQPDDGHVASAVAEALHQAEQATTELRELAHGILPAHLAHGGLLAGVRTVVTRLDLPVHVDLPPTRFPPEIEASAYFIVAEALTNVVKHAHATHAEVKAAVDDGMLHLEVRDDGIGGADSHGHGLVGIGDRAAALGGRLKIESPFGQGTLLAATLPLPAGKRPE